MIRERLARLGRFLREAFRRNDPPPPDAVPVAGSPFDGVQQYVRIHPRMAVLLAGALRGWKPRFQAKPRARKQPHEHTHARECARRLRQMNRARVAPSALASEREETNRVAADRSASERQLQDYIACRRVHVALDLAQTGFARPQFLGALVLAVIALVACSGCASVNV